MLTAKATPRTAVVGAAAVVAVFIVAFSFPGRQPRNQDVAPMQQPQREEQQQPQQEEQQQQQPADNTTHLPLPWPRAWVGSPVPLDPLSCMPSLLCIGAAKAGTSSLRFYAHFKQCKFHSFLKLHPWETHFFDSENPTVWNRPDPHFAWDKYLRSFPGIEAGDDPLNGSCSHVARLNLTAASPMRLVWAEKTPRYIYHPFVPERVQRLLPKARMLIILREPADRMISHFNMEFKQVMRTTYNITTTIPKPLPDAKAAAAPAHASTNHRQSIQLRKEARRLAVRGSSHSSISAGVDAPANATAGNATKAAATTIGDKIDLGRAFTTMLQSATNDELTRLEECYAALALRPATVRKQQPLRLDMLRCLGYQGPLHTPGIISDDESRQRQLSATGQQGPELWQTLKSVEYVWTSVYADQLEAWLQYFPPEQMLIWFSEDFKKRPLEHMTQLVEWLGLDPSWIECNASHFSKMRANEGRYPGTPPPDLMQRLRAFYAPHNARLAQLLRANGFEQHAQRMQELWQY